MVSKHQVGEFWALKNALEIRNKIFIKKLNYKINKIILTKCEQLFIMLLEMMKMIYNYNKLVRDKIPEEINNKIGRAHV